MLNNRAYSGVFWYVVLWVNVGIVENQMEKNMETYMAIGIL